MSIARWIVTVADAALFAAAVLTLTAAPVVCVLVVLPNLGAGEHAEGIEERRWAAEPLAGRNGPDFAFAVPALARRRRQLAP